LDWLNTQKSTINNLLNTTDFNIIQKQITENIEPTEISNNLQSLSLNEINVNKDSTKNEYDDNNNSNNNSIIDMFDEPPPSLLDFTKNITKEDKLTTQDKEDSSKKKKSKISSISINSIASLNEESKEQFFNKLLLKDTLSIENLNPLIEEIINKSKNKTSNVPNEKEKSILKKESRSLGNTKSKEFNISDNNKTKKMNSHHSFPHDLNDKIENHSMTFKKFENKDIFKPLNDEPEYSKELSPSSDALTDFKRSLNNYTARKKKSTLLSLNDTIDSSTTVKNNIETTKLMSPLTNLEDDTLTSNLNNNSMLNTEIVTNKNETENKLPEKSIEEIKMEDLNRTGKRISTLIDEVESLYKSHSPVKGTNESTTINNFDEFKDCDKVEDFPIKQFTPVKSKSVSSYRKLGEFKTCDEILEDVYRKAKTTEKKAKLEKRSVTATAFNILTSPFTPFSHGSHSEKKSKTVSSTPDKSVNGSENSKKSVSERFKAIWDSTTKGLHYAFSRKYSSDNEENKYPNQETKTIAPTIQLYNSPERDTNSTSYANTNASKSTNFRNEKNLKVKASSCSVPSKNKANLFNSNVDDYNIEFKDTNGMSFATAIQSPSESPLAFITAKKMEKNNKLTANTADKNKTKDFSVLDDNIFKSIIDDDESKSPYIPSSPLYNKHSNKSLQKSKSNNSYLESISQSPSKHLYQNKSNAMAIEKLKKSISDLTEESSYKLDSLKSSSSSLNSSWNSHYTNNSSKEQPSLIPKNSKFKKNNLKKTKSKIKPLESAKLIKKHDDILTVDKKQKLKMNAEKRLLISQKKKKEEEGKLATLKQQREEENRLKSDKNAQQKQVDTLIRKRKEKIKQVNERTKAMKMKEAKSLLQSNSTLYGTSSVMASTLDKFKNNNLLDTTIILKQKNSNSNTIKKSNTQGVKKSSVLSANLKKSSIPKAKSTMGKATKSNLSSAANSSRNSNASISVVNNPNASSANISNINMSTANISTQNILAALDSTSMIGFNNIDNSMTNDKKNSIISISSSRSSATPYRGTILQDGEFPDIPSDYDDDDDSRLSLVATWAKTPNLMKALERQKDVNPDVIFSGFKPCRLDEIFRGLSNVRTQPQPENWADSSILHDEE